VDKKEEYSNITIVELKPVYWIGSSKDELCQFPSEVTREMGYALHFAQKGEKHPAAKPLKGFGGAGVLEIIEDFNTDTYRAVYTVKFAEAVYVLHAFQKKSKKGIQTSPGTIKLIRQRLKLAEEEHKAEEWRKRREQQ
jgi:phage-related protein